MTILSPTPPGRMTTAEFLDWAAREDVGRVELVDGVVVAMAGETVLHNIVKRSVDTALQAALDKTGLPCRIFQDGIAVNVSEDTTYIPDVMVDCGIHEDLSALLALDPAIIVEILSESTRRKDLGAKMEGYLSVPNVHHYLAVDGSDRRVIAHSRRGEDILTRILTSGMLTLDPPGITVDISDFWIGLSAEGAS